MDLGPTDRDILELTYGRTWTDHIVPKPTAFSKRSAIGDMAPGAENDVPPDGRREHSGALGRRIASSCAGWAAPPTARELYDSFHTQTPTTRSQTILRMWMTARPPTTSSGRGSTTATVGGSWRKRASGTHLRRRERQDPEPDATGASGARHLPPMRRRTREKAERRHPRCARPARKRPRHEAGAAQPGARALERTRRRASGAPRSTDGRGSRARGLAARRGDDARRTVAPPAEQRHRYRDQLAHLARCPPRRRPVVEHHRQHRGPAAVGLQRPVASQLLIEQGGVLQDAEGHVGVVPGLELEHHQQVQPGAPAPEDAPFVQWRLEAGRVLTDQGHHVVNELAERSLYARVIRALRIHLRGGVRVQRIAVGRVV